MSVLSACLLFAVLALAVRYALDPSLGEGLPYSSVFAAIAASAWFLGAGPSIVAAVVGYTGGDLLFAAPRGELSALQGDGLVRFALFWISALVIIGMGHMAQQARSEDRSGTGETVKQGVIIVLLKAFFELLIKLSDRFQQRPQLADQLGKFVSASGT